jgi:lactate racemase
MKVHLAYGKTGMEIDVPDDRTDVVEPRYVSALPDAKAALRQALSQPIGSPPLRDLVSATDTVAIVVSDLTRPMPTADVVGAIVDDLPQVAADHVTIFIGLGTHRKMTDGEVLGVLGDLARRYAVSQTGCTEDGKFATIGVSKSGSPIRFVSDFLSCSVRIITGLMEPHFFAGVSGGPKGILPGLAHMDTVIGNHNAAHLLHPRTTWGVTAGNPLWEDIFDGAMLAKPTFLVNVTVNKEKRITGVFAGDIRAAFDRGAAFVRETAMVATDRLYDVVVTTNSGYPLDLNLYQSVKGMSAAAMILKPGGTIITAAECWDGVPSGSRMEAILHQVRTPEQIISGIEDGRFAGMDQWELLLYAKILQKATVYLKNSYLSDTDVRSCLALPCADVSITLSESLESYGSTARACILPEGPQTIPYYRQ